MYGSHTDDDLFSIYTTRVIKGRKQALAGDSQLNIRFIALPVRS